MSAEPRVQLGEDRRGRKKVRDLIGKAEEGTGTVDRFDLIVERSRQKAIQEEVTLYNVRERMMY